MGDVTVLGLGLMGSSLARGLMKAGHRTVVWNRTAARTEPLVAYGARYLAEPEAALQTWGAVLDHMMESASSAGFSDEFPRFARDLFRRAMERGFGEHDVAALIEVLRPRA